VSDDYRQVLAAPPFDDFKKSPIPTSAEQYKEYMDISKDLINKRNNRILKYMTEQIS